MTTPNIPIAEGLAEFLTALLAISKDEAHGRAWFRMDVSSRRSPEAVAAALAENAESVGSPWSTNCSAAEIPRIRAFYVR